MSWRFGIPDFIGNYVYFESLRDTKNNTPAAARYKQKLYNKTQKSLAVATQGITDLSKINQANRFLSQVAKSERNKEIKMIESFCKQTGMEFPALQPYLKNPQMIQDEPEKFYLQLTNAINVVRKGLTNYLTELKRIQSNIDKQNQTLKNYKVRDYRYRLNGSINSFLNRLRGQYNDIAENGQYNLKIQELVMRILSSTGIIQALSNGADFAAIAAATLADVEKQVQKEVDKNLLDGSKGQPLSSLFDSIADDLEKDYVDKILNKDPFSSSVQRALSDIQGIDFKRIVQNGKELLGLKTMSLDANKIEEHYMKIINKEQATKNSHIKNIRDLLSSNVKLKNNLNILEFSINGSVNTQHGTIYELVESSVLDSLGGLGGVSGGRNINSKSATDIITFSFNWDITVNNSAMNQLLSSISKTIADNTAEDFMTPNNMRDIRNSLQTMNTEINKAVKLAEEKIEKLKEFNVDDIFVYHESLKLYSSMETGRNGTNEFHGRNIGILKYIDYMASSQVSGGSALAASRDDLAFLGLNLTPGAVAEQAIGPLEKYFSMYASLLMFDDVTNMAMEAVETVQSNNKTSKHGITQIHLYNLNGIFVPASMLLSFVSDTVSGAGALISSGLSASASIHVPSTNEAYEAWKARKAAGNGRLYKQDWEDVAKEAARETKVSITFLSSFLSFVSSLGNL